MPVDLLIDKVNFTRGEGPHQQYVHSLQLGLLTLLTTDVNSHSDFFCSPDMEVFTLEQARTIGLQIRNGDTNGSVGKHLVWSLFIPVPEEA
jgi:hypothetical protein